MSSISFVCLQTLSYLDQNWTMLSGRMKLKLFRSKFSSLQLIFIKLKTAQCLDQNCLMFGVLAKIVVLMNDRKISNE